MKFIRLLIVSANTKGRSIPPTFLLIALAVTAFWGAQSCANPTTASYSVPAQLPEAVALPEPMPAARIVFDEVESHGQVLHGLHPDHPNWLEGRWMREEAVLVLGYQPDAHKRFVLRGSVEDYQLKQVGHFSVLVEARGKRLIEHTLEMPGNFEMSADIPLAWGSEPGPTELKISAKPSWTMQGLDERFTLTLIEALFEGGR